MWTDSCVSSSKYIKLLLEWKGISFTVFFLSLSNHFGLFLARVKDQWDDVSFLRLECNIQPSSKILDYQLHFSSACLLVTFESVQWILFLSQGTLPWVCDSLVSQLSSCLHLGRAPSRRNPIQITRSLLNVGSTTFIVLSWIVEYERLNFVVGGTWSFNHAILHAIM